jgi:uncharacterized protein (DUF1330 family)
MSKGYWVVTYRKIKNPEALAEYAKLVAPAVQAAGGRYIVRAPAAKAYELGVAERTVVVEFESMAEASAAHDSASYQQALKVLGNAVERDFRIVEGAA